MTLTGIDLQSKIARFFNYRIWGGNTPPVYSIY